MKVLVNLLLQVVLFLVFSYILSILSSRPFLVPKYKMCSKNPLGSFKARTNTFFNKKNRPHHFFTVPLKGHFFPIFKILFSLLFFCFLSTFFCFCPFLYFLYSLYFFVFSPFFFFIFFVFSLFFCFLSFFCFFFLYLFCFLSIFLFSLYSFFRFFSLFFVLSLNSKHSWTLNPGSTARARNRHPAETRNRPGAMTTKMVP